MRQAWSPDTFFAIFSTSSRGLRLACTWPITFCYCTSIGHRFFAVFPRTCENYHKDTARVRGGLLVSYLISNGADADSGVYEICSIKWHINTTSIWISLPELVKIMLSSVAQFDHPPVLRRRIVIRRRNRAWGTLENSLKKYMVFPFMNPRFKSINSWEEMISQNYSRSSQCGDRSGMIYLEKMFAGG